MARAKKVTPEQLALRNFARVSSLLALARRRRLCAWTQIFRAGATKHALDELNHSGLLTLAQYRCLDTWIFSNREAEQKSLVKAKGAGWWRPSRKPKHVPKPKLKLNVKPKPKKKFKFAKRKRRHAS